MSSAADYDQFPYASNPFTQTQPLRTGALARLFGMQPAALEGARVLELGCAAGGNLLPLAEMLPDTSFLAVDFSSRHVADARATVEALGLENVDIRQADIGDLGSDIGPFDYIICHGVYSWVPAPVQDVILRLLHECLRPHGVGYVSYNTYPGWHMRGMIRDMMLYHTASIEDPATRVAQARALLDFLASNVKAEQSGAFHALLAGELAALRNVGDDYLRHEHLSADNTSMYFHEFMQRAAGHGLQYVAEADLASMVASNLPAPVEETLRRVAPDILRMEQYMDFLRNRTFRQTLLGHDTLALNRHLEPEALAGLQVSARFSTAGHDAQGRPLYVNQSGASVASDDVALLAMLDRVTAAWPSSVAVDELFDSAAGAAGAAQRPSTRLDLLRCVCSGALELRSAPPPCVTSVSERPRASAHARRQAERGRRVTTLRHELVDLDDLGQHLVRRLDGSRDIPALVEALTDAALAGDLVVARDNQPLREREPLTEALGIAVRSGLERLAQQALLCA